MKVASSATASFATPRLHDLSPTNTGLVKRYNLRHSFRRILDQSEKTQQNGAEGFHQVPARRWKQSTGFNTASLFAMMVPAALLLAIALVTLYVARSVRTFFALRHFGGHWSAGWSRIWLLRTQSSGEMNKRFTEINDKYGECNVPYCRIPTSHKFADLPDL